MDEQILQATKAAAAGQLAAAFFTALAALLSWRAVRLAREEAARSRQSFQYNWEPMIEVTFEARNSPDRPDRKMVLPFVQTDPVYTGLPQEAQRLVTDIYLWKKQYSDSPTAIASPHPGLDFIVMTITNLQTSTAGQAVNIDILVEITLFDPQIGIAGVATTTASTKNHTLLLRLNRIHSAQHINVWLVDASNLPGLIIKVKSISCETWDKTVINRGVGSTIDLSAPVTKYTDELLRNQMISYEIYSPISILAINF